MVVRPRLFKLMRQNIYWLGLPRESNYHSSSHTADPTNQKNRFRHLVFS
jgi:hypothetical protein